MAFEFCLFIIHVINQSYFIAKYNQNKYYLPSHSENPPKSDSEARKL